ncbi:hypothetical protein GRI38_00890 [Altererythrobacter aurantiacus]|uniref:Uncharacterized protein n=1 Tax=Parapontixanthobacter aurantiacus TaxID=1463599 RepID=A0A844ZFS7_9SPHN|nr:hypothetical protein [Parapontixanthobacter aurantiacus]MXO84589.1 hypothetical protein [Parapontixanthobacter aurantiacus]
MSGGARLSRTGPLLLGAALSAVLALAHPATAQLKADRTQGSLKVDEQSPQAVAAPSVEAGSTAVRRKLECRTGPVIHQLGGTWWYVFSCTDEKSLIFVSDRRNPSYPFIFFALAQENRYELRGEGTGDSEAAAPAFKELESRTAAQLFELVAETEAVAK